MPRGKPTLGRRARDSRATRQKKAEAHRGRSPSPETRAKIAAALRGRPKDPEHARRIGDARRRRPPTPKTHDERIAAIEAIGRRRARAHNRLRNDQWIADKYQALRLGDQELFEDVVRSWGWRCKRRVFRWWAEGRVSCGYSKLRAEVLWDPATPFLGKKVPTNYRNLDGIR